MQLGASFLVLKRRFQIVNTLRTTKSKLVEIHTYAVTSLPSLYLEYTFSREGILPHSYPSAHYEEQGYHIPKKNFFGLFRNYADVTTAQNLRPECSRSDGATRTSDS